MGTLYAFTPPAEACPAAIEGEHVEIEKNIETDEISLNIILLFRESMTPGSAILGRREVDLRESVVLKYGGTPSQWAAILALTSNPSNLDDIVEAMSVDVWGCAYLLALWHGIMGT